MKSYKLLLASCLLFGTVLVVSSPVSAQEKSEQKTALHEDISLLGVYSPNFQISSFAVNDAQFLDIPNGDPVHSTWTEATVTLPSNRVIATANSPPGFVYR